MQDVASISAMQQIHFGRRIRCSDGEAGLLTQVVFDSASRRMTSLDSVLYLTGNISSSLRKDIVAAESRSRGERTSFPWCALSDEYPGREPKRRDASRHVFC